MTSPSDKSLFPEAVEYLDPALLSYEEWLQVGMAMHAEGWEAADWDAWSRRDAARYHPGECERKWASFGASEAAAVAGGTVVKMARGRGFVHVESWEPDEEIEWGAPIVDASWVEPAEIAEDAPWDPVAEAVAYLEAVFDPEDYVGYVTTAWKDEDGRWKPKGKGAYSRTAGELVAELKRTCSVEKALGTPNAEAGAWIRFNPLNGQGVRNVDVAEYRFALVESDEMDVGRQKALIDELELPCAAVVHSGGKSLHAIVRIDAEDYAEYRRRVDWLYETCRKNGLVIDTQNKNPSRLSRFPGFVRGAERQRMVSGPCGRRSWDEWAAWVEEADDGLPEIEPMGAFADVPEAPAQLVEGILCPGDKMMVAGPPKAGKSFALIELCLAIASGGEWFGRRCLKGKCLYVNLELKRDSRRRRMRSVAEAMGVSESDAASVHCLDLRGVTVPLDRLVRSIVRRTAREGYAAVVIDPIYKVMGGDESDSEAVKRFCDQLDKLAEALGCAVVYCHHYAKGDAWSKAAMDRASGSGVFSRDADTLLSMTEVALTDEARKQRGDDAVCRACADVLDTLGIAWREHVPYDDQVTAARMVEAARERTRPLGDREPDGRLTREVARAKAKAKAQTAWRVEGTFRELPPCEPIDLWFDHPVHEVDRVGVIGDLAKEGAEPAWRRSAKGRASQARSRSDETRELFEEAVRNAKPGGRPTAKDVAAYMDVSKDTVNRYVKRFGAKKVKVDDKTFEIEL